MAGSSEIHCLSLYSSGQRLTNPCCLVFLFIIILFFLFISLALFLQAKDNIINSIWLQSRHAPLPHKIIWLHMDVLRDNFSHRVAPALVSLSECNQISMFMWRRKNKIKRNPQLCKVLKVLLSKTGSQNWILLLAEHENILSHKKTEHVFCEKCATLFVSLFTLSRPQHWTSSSGTVGWWLKPCA